MKKYLPSQTVTTYYDQDIPANSTAYNDDRYRLSAYKERGGLNTKLEYYGTGNAGKIDLLKSQTLMDEATVLLATNYD